MSPTVRNSVASFLSVPSYRRFWGLPRLVICRLRVMDSGGWGVRSFWWDKSRDSLMRVLGMFLGVLSLGVFCYNFLSLISPYPSFYSS